MKKAVKKIGVLDNVPALQVPPFKYGIALANNVKQIMMTTWGGLGDQVCGEPAMRYAFKLFQGYEISLLTSFPDFFDHLPFKKIYKHGTQEAIDLNDEEWLCLHTNAPHETMARDFIQHHFTQVVDFASLCAYQRQLPLAHRSVMLFGNGDFEEEIVIHPGRHWQSKTFPVGWWNNVLNILAENYHGRIAVVGKDVDENTGTVDVTIPDGVKDYRNKLTHKNLISILKTAKVVLTNDSAPLHIAAAGEAHIFFIASCKEPEYLTHWRYNPHSRAIEFGWRMQNLGFDGLWNHQSSIPIRDTEFTIEKMDQRIMDRLLPYPREVLAEIKVVLKEGKKDE